MKGFLTLLLLTFLMANNGSAQCKFKGVPNKLKRYCVSSSKPNPDLATGLSMFFDRVYFGGQIGFAKEGDQYYLYLHLARNLSPAFEIQADNALTLTTASGQEVVAYPTGNYTGRRMIGWFALGCYYKLSKDQLEVLASDKVTSFQIQFPPDTSISTSSDDGGSGWFRDDKGQAFFRHSIDAEAKKEKCRKAAHCLLQKG